MQYITEYKSFYQVGDVVVLEYWYNDMLTPCIIVEKLSKVSYKVSHNVPHSKIPNAPDEIIRSSDIIDFSR